MLNRVIRYIYLKVLIIFINKNQQYMPYRKINLSAYNLLSKSVATKLNCLSL